MCSSPDRTTGLAADIIPRIDMMNLAGTVANDLRRHVNLRVASRHSSVQSRRWSAEQAEVWHLLPGLQGAFAGINGEAQLHDMLNGQHRVGL